MPPLPWSCGYCNEPPKTEGHTNARPIWSGVALARLITACAALATGAVPALAQSNNVRITNLSDVNYGSVSNLETDAVLSQSVCVFAQTATRAYRVTGSGSGAGGAFTLASATGELQYEVQWSQISGRSGGVQLWPNTPLTAQTSTATHQSCNSGPPTSASLILVLRSAALSSAPAGSYAGSLTLVIGPE